MIQSAVSSLHFGCKSKVLVFTAFFLALLFQVEAVGAVDDVNPPDGDGDADSEGDDMPFMWSCDDMTPNFCADLVKTEGYVETRNSLQLYYVKYSPPNITRKKGAESKAPYPVVMINGGPGMSHEYDLPYRVLACSDSRREVIFYDQGGTGRSGLPENATLDDGYSFLTNIDYLALEELPTLLIHLGFDTNKFHLIGESFGSQIAMKFATSDAKSSDKIQELQDNLVSLVFSGPIPSMPEYRKEAWDPEKGTIGRMPKHFRDRYNAIVKEKNFESEEFEEMETVLLTQFIYRSGVLPDCAAVSLGSQNKEIYMAMFGVSEFTSFPPTATLSDFDVFPQLHRIADAKIPTLITSGEYDTVRPQTAAKIHAKYLPSISEWVLIKNSGHTTILDEPGVLLDSIIDFFSRVEQTEGTEAGFVPKTISQDGGMSEVPIQPSVDLDRDEPTRHTLAWTLSIGTAALVLGVFVGRSRRESKRHREYDNIV